MSVVEERLFGFMTSIRVDKAGRRGRATAQVAAVYNN